MRAYKGTHKRIHPSRFLQDENAVSEVIGEILMTAIAVLAFSFIAVFVFSHIGADERVYANIDGWVDVESDTIHIRHAGGEQVDLKKAKVVLNLNGKRHDLPSSQLEQLLGSTSWHLGQTIDIDADALWNTTISENDYVGMILLQTNSNAVIESGSLLGDETLIGSGSGGNGNGSEEQQYPFVDFIYSPLSPGVYESVVFTDNSFDPDGNVVGWSWSFGDGGTSVNQNPAHQYSTAGNYTITLTAMDDDGNTNSTSKVVTVKAPPGIFADQIILNKPSKGGIIKDGGYISFTNDGKYRYIDIDGTRYSLNQNDKIKLEVVNDQTTGTISMNAGNSQISSFDLNVDLYIDDVLYDTGQVTNIYVQPISNYYSTLIYELPSHNSQTYLEADGGAIINWETNNSVINISNIGFYGSGNTQINFGPSSTYVKCSGYYQILSSEQSEELSVQPVSRWTFNEGSGSIAYDSAGNNNGQLVNARWLNNGVNGTAIRFDGNGDHLVVSDDPSLDFDQNMSILMWLRLQTNSGVALIGKGLNDQDNFDLLVIGGELYFEWDDSASNFVQTTGMNLQKNAWYQIGVVVDGTNAKFYKDGAFVEDHSMGGVPLAPNNNELWIGRQNYGNNDFYLRGYLDEIEIYDVALDGSDVADHYTETGP